MADIATRFLFTVTITVAPALVLGATPLGDRRIVQITGGSYEGPRLRGSVLPGGADWIIRRSDDVLQLDVRATLRTEDGALVNMAYRGVRHGPAEVIARLDRGEAVEPSEYYFRTTPYFETSAPSYLWLNKIVAVATGCRLPAGPIYDVYEVL